HILHRKARRGDQLKSYLTLNKIRIDADYGPLALLLPMRRQPPSKKKLNKLVCHVCYVYYVGQSSHIDWCGDHGSVLACYQLAFRSSLAASRLKLELVLHGTAGSPCQIRFRRPSD